MKKIVSLLLVFVLVLSCFVGCENNVESNEVSSEIILDENRPDNPQIRMTLAGYTANHMGCGISDFYINKAEYDSATQICVVQVVATLFQKANPSVERKESFELKYKLADDGSWEFQGKYPKILLP